MTTEESMQDEHLALAFECNRQLRAENEALREEVAFWNTAFVESRDGYEELIDALRKDAERLDWLESSETHHGFCHTSYGEYRYYAFQQQGYKSVREVIDAAMQPIPCPTAEQSKP